MRSKIEDRLRKKIFCFNNLLKNKIASIRQKLLINIFDLCINNLANNNKKDKDRSIYLLQRNTTFFQIAIYNFEENFEI